MSSDFDRFLGPDVNRHRSLPDIDLGIEPKMRKKMHKHLRKRFGPPTRWQRLVSKIRGAK